MDQILSLSLSRRNIISRVQNESSKERALLYCMDPSGLLCYLCELGQSTGVRHLTQKTASDLEYSTVLSSNNTAKLTMQLTIKYSRILSTTQFQYYMVNKSEMTLKIMFIVKNGSN